MTLAVALAGLLAAGCGGGGDAVKTEPAPEPAQRPATTPEPEPEPAQRPATTPEPEPEPAQRPAPTPEPEAALEPQEPDAPRPVAPNTPVAPAAPVGATKARVAVGDTDSGPSWSRVSETGASGRSSGSRNATVRSRARAHASGVRTGADSGSEDWIADRIALQPGLRDVRAHGAWRRDLTGAGVRIVVRDDPLDPEAEEIRGRTSTEGAALGYWSHESYFGGCSSFSGDSCREVEVESAEAARAWIADYLSENPYPSDDDSVFVRVQGTDEYFEVPALFDGEYIGTYFPRDPNRSHGTMVASVAAGKHLGAAPGATLVSQAVPFEYGDGDGQYGRMHNLAGEVWSSSGSLPVEVYEAGIRGVIVPGGGFFSERADAQRKAEIDEGFAKAIREGMAGADVVNRSYGYGGDWSDRARDTRTALEAQRWRAFARSFPETAKAIRQEHLAEENKVIFVSAAGNSYQLYAPNVLARTAIFVPELRGLHVAAAALNDGEFNTGGQPRSGDYSDRCGALPDDWDPAAHGRHYCISARGTVRATGPGETISTMSEVRGTSFAAPMVAGGLALMKQAFRGQLTPRELVRRLMDTADNTGIYTDPDIYGAGVMDLNAATNPIGGLATGTPGLQAPLAQTRLAVPAAWGDVGGRVYGEITSFDGRNGPFWQPLSSVFVASGSDWEWPSFDEDAHSIEDFTSVFTWTDAGKVQLGLAGEDGIGLSFAPAERLRLGFTHELSAVQGARPAGAFGASVSSSMAFVSRQFERPLGHGFVLGATAGLGVGQADYPGGGMFEAGQAIYSRGSVSLVHAGKGTTRLTVTQPLRAETGEGKLVYPTGRKPTGERVYASQRVSLAPPGREVRVAIRHERPVGRGRALVEAGHAFHAGHRNGASEARVFVGYRIRW